MRWLPWALIVGVALAASAYWYVASQGLSDDPAPRALWIWIGLTGVAAAVLVAGWRSANGGGAASRSRRCRCAAVRARWR